MPKTINNFTVHIDDPQTTPVEMKQYLKKRFGEYGGWYMRRNYERPMEESVLEVRFEGAPDKRHTLMMIEHPYTLMEQDITEVVNADNKFKELFGE